MTVSQTNMAVDYSLTLPFRLVTKDLVRISLCQPHHKNCQ